MILYPNLLKHDVTLTPTWSSIVERVSLGDAPYGTHITQNKLIFKQHTVELTQSTPQDIIDFFIYIVGLNLQYIHFKSWKEIKRKTIKDNLIHDFVLRMASQYNLEMSQQKYLLSLIHLYITLKKITPNDIHLETGTGHTVHTVHTYIHSIRGLQISSDNIMFNPNSPTSDSHSQQSQHEDEQELEEEEDEKEEEMDIEECPIAADPIVEQAFDIE
jgi:hypothetical protein